MALADTGAWTGIAQSAIAAASGLLGVAIGGFMTARNQRAERENARIREKLQEFYSPILGIRSRILAKSEVRQKIRAIAGTAWADQFNPAMLPDTKHKIADEASPSFDKLQDYNNTQLREEIVPLYRKMLEHFSDHMWLAERSTQKHYDTLCEFVEIWNRFLAESLPAAVAGKIEHDEKKLYAFYNDLQDNFDRLTKELNQ